MKCYIHDKIAVANCTNCQTALCEECAKRFPKVLCYDCAEIERRNLVEKNQKLKKFLTWSVPIGMILGLVVGMYMFPGKVDNWIITTICGGTCPVVLRRIYLGLSIFFGIGLDLMGGGILGFGIGILLVIVAVVALVYIFIYSWIGFIAEIVLYYIRKEKIENYSSLL